MTNEPTKYKFRNLAGFFFAQGNDAEIQNTDQFCSTQLLKYQDQRAQPVTFLNKGKCIPLRRVPPAYANSRVPDHS